MHCVPYSQNELLQCVILAKSIGPLYVIVIYYINKFYGSNLERQQDALENHYLIQTVGDVEIK